MWLVEYHQRFLEAVERSSGRVQDLALLEQAMSEARRLGRVRKTDIEAIESSGAWTYARWWPSLSAQWGGDVACAPPKGHSARQGLIREFHNRLKHIEVVSIVLRFLYPEQFGILSPPVVAELCLAPSRNHVDYYLKYLKSLEDLSKLTPSVRRFADVDMALWSAAHLRGAYPDLEAAMERDETYQSVRLGNLMDGLNLRQPSGERPLNWPRLVAKAIKRYDKRIAAAVLAQTFEDLVVRLARARGVKMRARAEGAGLLQHCINYLQATASDGWSGLGKGRDYRDRAVHPAHENGPLKAAEVDEFANIVGGLERSLDRANRRTGGDVRG